LPDADGDRWNHGHPALDRRARALRHGRVYLMRPGKMDPRVPARLSIKEILHPRVVAVFGASDNRDKFGGRIMYFLTKHRFGGRIMPINPRRAEVFGHIAYPSIGHAPEKVDVAILAVPATELVGSIGACAEAGVGCCVIMTTGFAEAGAEGAARQEEI